MGINYFNIMLPQFQFNFKNGIALILIFGVPRFILVLNASQSGNYSSVAIIFFVMWLVPFVLLGAEQRKAIGMLSTVNVWWVVYSFSIGVLLCAACYLVSKQLFGNTLENSFVYISRSYAIPGGIAAKDRAIYFVIYSLIGMTFSPIGEEILYRGVIHHCFLHQFGEKASGRIESAAFAFTHLAHFGVIYDRGDWRFAFFPALVWISSMFLASQLFLFCKRKTRSLLGAIVCHAGYNLGMMYFIFYKIL